MGLFVHRVIRKCASCVSPIYDNWRCVFGDSCWTAFAGRSHGLCANKHTHTQTPEARWHGLECTMTCTYLIYNYTTALLLYGNGDPSVCCNDNFALHMHIHVQTYEHILMFQSRTLRAAKWCSRVCTDQTNTNTLTHTHQANYLCALFRCCCCCHWKRVIPLPRLPARLDRLAGYLANYRAEFASDGVAEWEGREGSIMATCTRG